MTLALDALVVAGGILVGRLIARAFRRGDRDAAGRASGKESAGEAKDPFAGFPCKLGDVVSRRLEGDEAWLAGALLFEEERPVAALFVAPEAHADRAVLAPGPGQTTLAWLTPLPERDAPQSAEPARSLELAGVLFERTRRLPVNVRRLGTGAPDVGPTAVVAEYAGPGKERLVVVAGVSAIAAWRGVALAVDDYEVLPGGETSLES